MATQNGCYWESLVRGHVGKARPVTAWPEGRGASGRDAGVSNLENRAEGDGQGGRAESQRQHTGAHVESRDRHCRSVIRQGTNHAAGELASPVSATVMLSVMTYSPGPRSSA